MFSVPFTYSQCVQQSIPHDDTAQRTNKQTSVTAALHKHTLEAMKRGPAHLPGSGLATPSKSCKTSPGLDSGPHMVTVTPKKLPEILAASNANVGCENKGVGTMGAPGPMGGRSRKPSSHTGAIPGIVAPGPLPTTGPAGVPGVMERWPVLPYLENIEHAIVKADTQPLTFHRTTSRPMSDFLHAVMHSLGVQVCIELVKQTRIRGCGFGWCALHTCFSACSSDRVS